MIPELTDGALAALFGMGGGIVLGLAARLGRFCTLGAIEDYLYADSDTRLRMWGLAIGVAMIASFGLIGFGYLDINQIFYLDYGWSPVASIGGGLIFGYGMALAGNCGFGALARLGGGDMRAFVVVLVLGVCALITLSGPLAEVRLAVTELTNLPTVSRGYSDLIAQSLSVPAHIPGLVVGILIAGYCLTAAKFRTDPKAVFWASAVGLAVASGWAGTQWIATTGFDDIAVVSHTFSAPPGDTLLYLMTSSAGGINFGIGSVAGVLIGALIGSLIKGHFRWEACEDPRELRRQILGAAMMGVGAVFALGCTIGQGVSAFSVLAFSAPVVFVSIFAGCFLGLRRLIEGIHA